MQRLVAFHPPRAVIDDDDGGLHELRICLSNCHEGTATLSMIIRRIWDARGR